MPHFRRMSMLPVKMSLHFPSERAWGSRPYALIALAVALVASGREQRRSTPAIDSSVPLRPAAIGTSGAASATTWDSRLGPLLLISGTAPEVATVVIGDSSRADTVSEKEAITIRSTPAVLIGRGDSVQIGILHEVRTTKTEDKTERTVFASGHV